jgi:hypothetical protein
MWGDLSPLFIYAASLHGIIHFFPSKATIYCRTPKEKRSLKVSPIGLTIGFAPILSAARILCTAQDWLCGQFRRYRTDGGGL